MEKFIHDLRRFGRHTTRFVGDTLDANKETFGQLVEAIKPRKIGRLVSHFVRDNKETIEKVIGKKKG